MVNLLKKLHAINSEIETISKDGHNDFQNYDYSTEKNFLELIRPLVKKHNVVITSDMVEDATTEIEGIGKDGVKKTSFLVKVKMCFKIWDVESGEMIESNCSGHGIDTGDKGIYKAITGATKYFIAKFFLVPTGDDPENEKEETPKYQKTVARPAIIPARPVATGQVQKQCETCGNYFELAPGREWAKLCMACFKAGTAAVKKASTKTIVNPDAPPFPDHPEN